MGFEHSRFGPGVDLRTAVGVDAAATTDKARVRELRMT
jgi:hypothetical protein